MTPEQAIAALRLVAPNACIVIRQTWACEYPYRETDHMWEVSYSYTIGANMMSHTGADLRKVVAEAIRGLKLMKP